MTAEPRKRHAVGLFDDHAKGVFTSAQQDAERRGAKVLVSGLILLAAANADGGFSAILLDSIGCDLDRLTEAVAAEWNARSRYLQDQPVTLVNEAFQSVAAEAQPGVQLHLPSLLATMLRYPDSMASRVATRVGVEPNVLAERLAST